jgi:O-6-methylguanine DNA methyltransferase
MNRSYSYQSPIGSLNLTFDSEKRLISCLDAQGAIPLPGLSDDYQHLSRLLDSYFRGEKVNLSTVSLSLSGSEFSNRILTALLEIPYGEVLTYAGLAERAGRREAVRAAAHAVAQNRHLLFVPCHRVIRSDRRAGKFRLGEEVKRYLLDLEGCQYRD